MQDRNDFSGASVALVNVSRAGFCLNSDCEIPSGAYVPFTFKFYHTRLEVEGRVAWKKIHGPQTGPLQKQYGVLVIRRYDFEKYAEEVCSDMFKKVRPRRVFSRRNSPSQLSPMTNEFRTLSDRRGIQGLKSRLTTESIGSDTWSAGHLYGRVTESGPGPTVTLWGKEKVMLGSNNYLGLTGHPMVKEATIRAVEKYGTGAGGARVLSGTIDIHKELEEYLARFMGTEDCHLCSSGFVANAVAITAVIKKGDVVFNDEVNHASIIDGCRATDGIVRFFKHRDIQNLEKKLSQYQYEHPKLIITDGVFSMDGDAAPLADIVSMAKKHNAMVMVDEAHSTGVLGLRGHGTAEHYGILGEPDITIVTFSKSLGAIGGAVCGSRSLIKKIFNTSRGFIFTSSLPPAVCAGVLASLKVIDSTPELIRALHRNQHLFFERLRKMGYVVQETISAVIPVIIADEQKTYRLASLLDKLGVFVNAVTTPAVPREKSRIRVSLMATHTPEHLDKALEAFQIAGKEVGVI
jgi:8-amino-7-oxononanoate synthase